MIQLEPHFDLSWKHFFGGIKVTGLLNCMGKNNRTHSWSVYSAIVGAAHSLVRCTGTREERQICKGNKLLH